MMKCKYCNREVNEGHLFCVHCGKDLSIEVVTCQHCGFKVNAEDSFCIRCGKDLSIEVVTCQHCGHKANAEDSFCVSCGKPIEFKVENLTTEQTEHRVEHNNINTLKEDKEAVKNLVETKNLRTKIILIVSIALVLILALLYRAYETDKYKMGAAKIEEESETTINNETKDLSHFKINETTSLTTIKKNMSDGGYSYMYGDKIYINIGYQIIEMDRDFTNQKVIIEDFVDGLYIDDNYYYYSNYDDYVRVNKNTDVIEIIVDGYILGVQFAGDNMYYQKDYGGNIHEYNFTTKTKRKISTAEVSDFTIDHENNRIFYCDYDYKIYMSDLNGENEVEILLEEEAYGFIYQDNIIYYTTANGLKSYDLTTTNNEVIVSEYYGYNFNIIGDKFVFNNFDGYIYLVSRDGAVKSIDIRTVVEDNLSSLEVIGDKIIAYTYSGERYVVNLDGEYAEITDNGLYKEYNGIKDTKEF